MSMQGTMELQPPPQEEEADASVDGAEPERQVVSCKNGKFSLMNTKNYKPVLFTLLPVCLVIAGLSSPALAQEQKQEQPPENKIDSTSPEKEGKPTVGDLQKLYDQGKYKDILQCVRSMSPSPMTHYYTGLAYQGMNQTYRAAVEYNYVSQNAKDRKLKDNASRALKSLYSIKRRTRSGVRDDDSVEMNDFMRYGDHTQGPSSRNDAKEAIMGEIDRQKRISHPNRDRYGNWAPYH